MLTPVNCETIQAWIPLETLFSLGFCALTVPLRKEPQVKDKHLLQVTKLIVGRVVKTLSRKLSLQPFIKKKKVFFLTIAQPLQLASIFLK